MNSALIKRLRKIATLESEDYGAEPQDHSSWQAADLIERQAAQIEMLREALRELIEFELLDAGVQSSDELCFEFREAVKAYNQTTPDQALEQFTERVREQCAKVCDTADKSTHPADLANALRAIKELP